MTKKNSLWVATRNFLFERFNLDEDKAHEQEVIDSISKGVEFKGTNLWILIFAIFLAAIGLNVNSPAVIIGAMLISPLMGPIMGIGLGVGISDFSLIKKAAKNFGIAVVIGILTSTLYFLITPLSEARSELLARTSPAIWDVFIAFFGGLAGIVAGSRKDKSLTVIPGVAIATALMPPLCTAGFGIATGSIVYFAGAMYLFFINAVFISLATYIIVRFLKYPQLTIIDPVRAKKVKQSVYVVVIITLLPSIYMSYDIAMRSIFENNARKFINYEFDLPNTQVISQSINIIKGNKEIEIVIIGDRIDDDTLKLIRSKMAIYNLSGAELHVIQGLSGNELPDLNQMKSDVFQDIINRNDNLIREKNLQINNLEAQLADFKFSTQDVGNISKELKAQYPKLNTFSMAKTILYSTLTSEMDTVLLVYASFNRKISTSDRKRIEDWIKVRTNSNKMKLIIE